TPALAREGLRSARAGPTRLSWSSARVAYAPSIRPVIWGRMQTFVSLHQSGAKPAGAPRADAVVGTPEMVEECFRFSPSRPDFPYRRFSAAFRAVRRSVRPLHKTRQRR